MFTTASSQPVTWVHIGMEISQFALFYYYYNLFAVCSLSLEEAPGPGFVVLTDEVTSQIKMWQHVHITV